MINTPLSDFIDILDDRSLADLEAQRKKGTFAGDDALDEQETFIMATRGEMRRARDLAHAKDTATLEWAAQWIEGSLKGETNERVIEFGKNMIMTLRATTA